MPPIDDKRHENYRAASAALAATSDADIAAKLNQAKQVHDGIGGTAVKLEIGGVPVFAKKIALTDLEMQNPHSTRNLFDLPVYYQYGVGSSGFGVWRELEAHKMSTQWVLDGECPNFPLMYGFKVVPRDKQTEPINEEELRIRTEYWGGSKEVEARLQAIHNAKYDVVLFLEHAPQNLCQYMGPQASEGAYTTRPDMKMIETDIKATTDFMAKKRMLHFDTHHGNIVTDGQRLLITDFGLAISLDFELSAAEQKFYAENQGYDQVLALSCFDWPAKTKDGEAVPKLPEVEAVAQKYKQLSEATEKFRTDLRDDKSKRLQYPAAQMQEILQRIDRPSPSPEPTGLTNNYAVDGLSRF